MENEANKGQETENREGDLQVGTSDLLPCICPGLQGVIRRGKKQMKAEGAPGGAIADYVNEMTYGQWVHCSCPASAIVE